jgi:hypothetical protein
MALNARAKNKSPDYTLFDVVYEDGTRTSNRKIPADELIGEDQEGAAKAFIEAQDRKIAEASGKPRGVVQAVFRLGR